VSTTTQSSRLGMHDALRRAADAGRRKERQTDIPSAPRSRQAMVVGERCPRDRRPGAGLEPVATLPAARSEKSAAPY
jgi:hypothetical protein